jgi:hypothetical protein
MNSQPEPDRTVTRAELQKDRAALQECIQCYDRLTRLLDKNPNHSTASLRGSNRLAAIEQVASLTASLREAAASSEEPAQPDTNASKKRLKGLRRVIPYGALVVAVCAIGWWWLYHRPVSRAQVQLHGSWQHYVVTDVGETLKQYYRTFRGDKLTTSYYVPHDDKWREYSRRAELTPAVGFFKVKLTGSRNGRPVVEPEFYIQIEGDTVNEIRGIHRLDPMRRTEVNLWRRVDSVPTDTSSNSTGGTQGRLTGNQVGSP